MDEEGVLERDTHLGRPVNDGFAGIGSAPVPFLALRAKKRREYID